MEPARLSALRRYAFSIDPDLVDRRRREGDNRFVIMMASCERIGFFKSGNKEWTYI